MNRRGLKIEYKGTFLNGKPHGICKSINSSNSYDNRSTENWTTIQSDALSVGILWRVETWTIIWQDDIIQIENNI